MTRGHGENTNQDGASLLRLSVPPFRRVALANLGTASLV